MFNTIPVEVLFYECWGISKDNLKPKKCVNLSGARSNVHKHIYPHIIKNETCVMMITSNLAQPKWIYMSCETPILSNVICVRKHRPQISLHYLHQQIAKSTCYPSQILINQKCYLFVWYTSTKYKGITLARVCNIHNTMLEKGLTNAILEVLLNAVSVPFPPILIQDHWKGVSYIKQNVQIKGKNEAVSLETAKGLTACSDANGLLEDKEFSFMCTNGIYISYLLVCDGNIDCKIDDSDETHYLCQSQATREENVEGMFRSQCAPLFHRNKNSICQKFYPLPTNLTSSVTMKKLFCQNGDEMYENDLFGDCGPDGEDEPMFRTLLANTKHVLCEHEYELPCLKGHTKCFNITDICSYTLNDQGHLIPCRNGQHLQNCRMFECNLKFKCPNSYCIPWSYVCNNRWDCPKGSDESTYLSCRTQTRCVGMYMCHSSVLICIMLQNVCDGKRECIEGDDEFHCELQKFLCPSNCMCLMFAISCSNGNILFDTQIYMSIFISGIVILDFKQIIKNSLNMVHCKIHNCGVTDPCYLDFPARIHTLDIGKNNIIIVKGNCFKDTNTLEVLLLDLNSIKYLNSYSFKNTQNLQYLNLSNNPLSNFPSGLFYYSQFLKMLSLRKIAMLNIDPNMFYTLQVAYLDTDDYHICCIAPLNSKCEAENPWFIKCSNLLPDYKLKIAFITFPGMIILLNTLSIVMHSMNTKVINRAFGTTVTSLSLNYILLAVYLKLVWIHHLYFSETFPLIEHIWRSSTFCFMAFFTFLLFSFLTQMLSIFLALSRLMITLKPLSTHFKYNSIVTKWIISMFVSCFILSLIATMHVKLTSGIIPFKLCFPFVDPTNSIISIKFLTWVTVITQTITLLALIILHLWLILHINSKKNLEKSKTKMNTSLAIQLIVMTVFNLLCWVSLNCIYVSVMHLKKYPVDLIIWSTIVILPLNAIFHPLLFFTVSLKKLIFITDQIKIFTDIKTAPSFHHM